MPRAGLRGLLCEAFREVETVAGKVVCRAMHTLLEDAIGMQRADDRLSVPSKRFFALQLVVRSQTTQAVHLVAHLAGRDVGRAAQSRIKGAHPLEERHDICIEGVAGRSEFALAFNGHGSRGEQLRQRIGVLGKDAIEHELVLAQQLGDRGFNQCGGEARFRWCCAAQYSLEEDGGLREIGNLGGTTDGKGRREQVVLENGP